MQLRPSLKPVFPSDSSSFIRILWSTGFPPFFRVTGVLTAHVCEEFFIALRDHSSNQLCLRLSSLNDADCFRFSLGKLHFATFQNFQSSDVSQAFLDILGLVSHPYFQPGLFFHDFLEILDFTEYPSSQHALSLYCLPENRDSVTVPRFPMAKFSYVFLGHHGSAPTFLSGEQLS